ncbi:MAG TPA: hypothetical protein VFT37_02005 [Telluria sp.]|nr:hypothetical protein [Telluria sp.]
MSLAEYSRQNLARAFGWMLTSTPNRSLKREQSADLLAAALLLLLCVAFYLPKLAAPISAQDEGILLAYPDLILRGYLPYRDFAALYTPGSLYLVSLAFGLFGESLLVERAVGLLYWWALACSLYFIGLSVSRLTGYAAALATVIGLIFFPAGAYAMTAALALALGALLAAYRSYASGEPAAQRRLSLLAGASAGGALWFRHDVGVLVSAALFFMFLTGPRFRLARFFGGVFLVGVPLLAYLGTVGLDVSFESLVLDVLRNGPGRKLPLVISPALLALFALVAATVAAAVYGHIRKFAHSERVLMRGAAILAAGLLPSVLQRADGWHIIYVAGPVLGLAIVCAGLVLKAGRPGTATLRLSVTGSVCVMLALVVLSSFSAMRVKHTVPIVSGDRLIHFSAQPTARDLQRTVDELNRVAQPGWRIFIGPNDLRYTNYNDSFLYFLLPQLAPSSRFIELNPGVANRTGSGLAEQIASADVVVLNSSYDNWREPNASSVPGPDAANRVVAERYCEHRRLGHWRILLRCQSTEGNDG